MKVFPDVRNEKGNKEAITKKLDVLRRTAIVFVIVVIYFFFIKLLFL